VGATLQMQEERSLLSYASSLREEKERLSKLHVRGASHLDVRASFSLSLKLLEEAEVDFLSCLSVCAQDGFSVLAAMAAGGCDEDTTHERLGYLYRLSLLNRPQAGAGRFVFHPLIRLFARELAAERSLLEDAAQRHASYYVQLVKSSPDDERGPAALLASELDDILLAAGWLQQHGTADYEFVITLEPFLQNQGHWQQAVDIMSGFLELAERTGDLIAEIQLRIQQAKFLSLRGEWTRAEAALSPVTRVLEEVESERTRLRLEAMWLNTLGGIQQRLGRFDAAADTLRRSADIEEKLNNQAGEAKALNSLGGVLQRQGRFDEASKGREAKSVRAIPQ
jgi:tetratricopeptide (TPR) repeat protein